MPINFYSMTKCEICGKRIVRGNLGQKYCLCGGKAPTSRQCSKCHKWLFSNDPNQPRCLCHEANRLEKAEREFKNVEGMSVFGRLTYHLKEWAKIPKSNKTDYQCKRKAIRRNMRNAEFQGLEINWIGLSKKDRKLVRSRSDIYSYLKRSHIHLVNFKKSCKLAIKAINKIHL